MGATYVGGFITARSTRTVDLAVSPARQVPGRANRPVVAVGADPRVFTAHGRAVLVAGPRQSVQEIEGVDEQYLGRATVVPDDARVARPPLLADLDWSAFGGTADAAEPDRWQLAGVVILGTGGDSDHLPMRWGSSRGDLAAWRQLLWSRSTCGSVDTLRWPDHTLEAAQFGASPSRGGFGMGR